MLTFRYIVRLQSVLLFPNGEKIKCHCEPEAKQSPKPPLVGGSKSQISRRGKTYAKNKSNLTPHPTLRVSLSLLDYSGPPRRWRGQERSKVRPAPFGFRFAPPYRKSATRGIFPSPFTPHSSHN